MHQLSPEDEYTLLLHLQQGDELAFNTLYTSYKKQLFRQLKHVLKDSQLVEDAIQDLFLKVWDKRTSIDPDQSFPGYLTTMAKNLTVDHYRKQTRNQQIIAYYELHSEEVYTHVEELINAKENAEFVRSIVSELPPQQQKAYTLHKLDGKSHQEIGEEMNISPSTVNKHIIEAHKYVQQQVLKRYPLTIAILISLFLTF